MVAKIDEFIVRNEANSCAYGIKRLPVAVVAVAVYRSTSHSSHHFRFPRTMNMADDCLASA